MYNIRGYLGIDVGSISTNIVLIGVDGFIIDSIYRRTHGAPIKSVQNSLQEFFSSFETEPEILGVGTTGSARNLVGYVVGADIIKNEITAHGLAAISTKSDVQTVLEIGGQDSKIILIRNEIIVDFGMNSVCAAGTGSFLDQQANRLKVPIEEFGKLALSARKSSPIAGRCTVFAESDMIHKQQLGYARSEIIAGLCDALVRNYFNNVAKGKDIQPPFMFQGGVAANAGIKAAFEKILQQPVFIPPYFNVMGAFGAALLAKEMMENSEIETAFRGINLSLSNFETRGFICNECPNNCEVMEIIMNGTRIAYSGDRCGRYSNQASEELNINKKTCSQLHCETVKQKF